MTEQLPLTFKTRPEANLENFFAGDNQQILDSIQRLLQSKIAEQLYISGASNSGKTHLLMGACQAAEHHQLRSAYLPLEELQKLSPTVLQNMSQLDFIAVDNVQKIAEDKTWEEALFVFFNQAKESGCRLLFSADCGPASLKIQLADLKSRLAWGTAYQLQPLSDEHKQLMLIHNAKRRGLTLKTEAASYLVSHYSRDIKALLDILDRLDHASLASQRKLTVPFIKQQL